MLTVRWESWLASARHHLQAWRDTDSQSPADEAPSDPMTELARDSAFPALRVLNQSHLGLMYAPTDPLFGTAGRILVCNGNEYPVYSACMRSTRHWFGAQHTASPDGIPVARATFNADREGVLEVFDQWLLHATSTQ